MDNKTLHREGITVFCMGPELHQKWQISKDKERMDQSRQLKQRQFAEVQRSVCLHVVSMMKHNVNTYRVMEPMLLSNCYPKI